MRTNNPLLQNDKVTCFYEKVAKVDGECLLYRLKLVCYNL